MIVKKDFSINAYNSYALDAVFKTVYFPQTTKDFVFLAQNNLLRTDRILGRGNNVILSKEYYDDFVVIIHDNFSNITIDGNSIYATSGVDMKLMSVLACNHGLSGLEYFYDIPSSFGGALFMNAGSNDCEINNFVKKVEVININTGQIATLNNSEYKYSYRYTSFKELEFLILSASIELPYSSSDDIFDKMLEIRSLRHFKQPRNFPSAGSVFKRPDGHYVGPMIEKLGLKGFSIGGAQVSEKHAGFIVNKGNAKGTDIITLIKHIQSEVYKHYRIELELEQIVI